MPYEILGFDEKGNGYVKAELEADGGGATTFTYRIEPIDWQHKLRLWLGQAHLLPGMNRIKLDAIIQNNTELVMRVAEVMRVTRMVSKGRRSGKVYDPA